MGKCVGHYELHDTIGQGLTGKVKRAINVLTGDHVAIKIIEKGGLNDQNRRLQIKKEIAVLKKICHPNVVSLVEVLASTSKVFLVMELITGGRLFDIIAASGKLRESVARKWFKQLVLGVQHCHQKGVVHRDLKPQNLLLQEGDLKISDFGLSALQSPSELSPTLLLHTACGSPAYCSPEVLAEDLAHTGYNGAAADVWSCGVILYMLLCGVLPFDEPSATRLYSKIQSVDFYCPDHLSCDAADLICKILVKDPVARLDIEGILAHPWMRLHALDATAANDEQQQQQQQHATATNGADRSDDRDVLASPLPAPLRISRSFDEEDATAGALSSLDEDAGDSNGADGNARSFAPTATALED